MLDNNLTDHINIKGPSGVTFRLGVNYPSVQGNR